MIRARTLLLGVVALVAACDKVPLSNVEAGFTLADATWFQDEETLFVFYRVDAAQGIGDETQLEVTWRTDDEELPWTALSELTPVHGHLPVDCGTKSRCGSTSLHVRGVPRSVGVRMRYHREGELVLDAPVKLNHIGSGPPHLSRSLVVYGVFDEKNQRVQWRARHQFPTLRNHEVQDLGLRRFFRVNESWFGDMGQVPADNPYGYGFAGGCDPSNPLATASVETTERAIFDLAPLPFAASTSPHVCALTTVTDAKGPYDAVALARKNPDVSPAFPALRSPVKDNTPIKFVLRPCTREISQPHLDMQIQRLLAEGAEQICTDDFRQSSFAGELAAKFRARIDQVRMQGQDMVLVIGLHHDDSGGTLGTALEQALSGILPVERDKSSPRVSGAFVFDSLGYTVQKPEVRQLALWCPANIGLEDLDQTPSNAEQTCPLIPDMPDLVLGPFRFANLPILPTRKQYLNFIDKYSEAQAGRMKKLTFRAPERTPFSENIPLGDFGTVTFFNNEVLTAEPTDVFSYCAPENPLDVPVAFKTQLAPIPAPLDVLPQLHATAPQPLYELGIFWDFPFFLRLEYETVVSGAASAYGFSVPFGIANPAEAYQGTQIWTREEFPLHDRLLRCTRFCEHPTFDSAGVYNVTTPFNPTFLNQCYAPRFPVPEDGGFPLDP